MYDDIKQTFTKEQLSEMKIVQLKKLFDWYGISYPVGYTKSEVIDMIFAEPEPNPIDVPMSVRIRRINYGK